MTTTLIFPRNNGAPDTHERGTQLTIVGILVVVILILIVIYLFRRV